MYERTILQLEITCIGLGCYSNLVVYIINLNSISTENSLFTTIAISVDILCGTYLFLGPFGCRLSRCYCCCRFRLCRCYRFCGGRVVVSTLFVSCGFVVVTAVVAVV